MVETNDTVNWGCDRSLRIPTRTMLFHWLQGVVFPFWEISLFRESLDEKTYTTLMSVP